VIIARANGAPEFDSISVDLEQCYGGVVHPKQGGVRLVVTDFYGKDILEASDRLQVLSESMHTYIVKCLED